MKGEGERGGKRWERGEEGEEMRERVTFTYVIQLLKWLEEKLPTAGKLPSEFSSIVPPLFSCLEDRSGDVRKKAQAALPHIMAHVGYDNMCRQCGKLGVSSAKCCVVVVFRGFYTCLAPPLGIDSSHTNYCNLVLFAPSYFPEILFLTPS